MKKILRMQLQSICLLFFGIEGSIGLALISGKVFGLTLPVWILELAIILWFVLDAGIRISRWSKRKAFLSAEELERLGTKLYFVTAWGELFFVCIFAGFARAS